MESSVPDSGLRMNWFIHKYLHLNGNAKPGIYLMGAQFSMKNRNSFDEWNCMPNNA